MNREKDIFEIFNEVDELLENANSNKESTTKNDDLSNIPKMPNFYIDDEQKKLNDISEKNDEILINLDVVEENNQQEKEKTSKSKKRKTIKKKNKSKKWIITFVILDFLALLCLFLMYGPISYFRNLWVTSAMTTGSHQYLAYIFFNEDQIKKILENNVVIEVEGNTNEEEIKFETNENVENEEIVYSSPEEEQILKRNEGNDLYKVIDIEGPGYKGHMVVVYDPSKIQLVQSPSKQYGLTIEQFVEKNGAVAGTNAGGFIYNKTVGYTPLGDLIDDGVVINTGYTGWGGGIVGFNQDNVLVLTKDNAYDAVQKGVRDAVSFGPFLIVNGVASQFKGNGGYGIAPRTAIGQRKDGIVLMLVINGRLAHSIGADMIDLTDIMERYGAYNAANLDGGSSSELVINGQIINTPVAGGRQGLRDMSTFWIVK